MIFKHFRHLGKSDDTKNVPIFLHVTAVFNRIYFDTFQVEFKMSTVQLYTEFTFHTLFIAVLKTD